MNWKEKFAELIPKDVDLLQEALTEHVLCSRKAIEILITSLITEVLEQQKRDIVKIIEEKKRELPPNTEVAVNSLEILGGETVWGKTEHIARVSHDFGYNDGLDTAAAIVRELTN